MLRSSRRGLLYFIQAARVSLVAVFLILVPAGIGGYQKNSLAVNHQAMDFQIDVQATHNDAEARHGGPGGSHGHLPSSSLNVELVGHVTVTHVVPNRISDVAVLGNYAYLGATSIPGGVYVIDISNPTEPAEVGFISTASGSIVGEGVQAISLNTPFFKGNILVINNEISKITGTQIGGFSLFDITNPLEPVALVQGAGDSTPSFVAETNTIHSAFAWQQGTDAYVVAVDDEEDADVDIFNISNPRVPFQVAEVGLANWPGAQNSQSAGMGNLSKSFFHDVVVKMVNGHWMMLLSYWDAGFILLNVDNPAAPVFVNDTDFTDPDPITGLSPPEGNAHQAEWSYDNKFILGTDEDFWPYRAQIRIGSGPFTGQSFYAAQGNDSSPVAGDRPLSGPTYFVGIACNSLPPPAAPSHDAIAVIERGICSYPEKVANAQKAGYSAQIIFNSATPGNCDAIGRKANTSKFPFLDVNRSTGFAILGISGYNPANCPNGSNPALPPPGTAGSTVTLSSQFDGWGYVHLFDAGTLQELDTYIAAEGLDPAFARGFGWLTVHEVATDPKTNLAYLSYYNAGMRVIKFDESGIQEVGHFIDTNGIDIWGVEVFRLPNDPLQQAYVAASDRDSGLYIFKYAGP